MFFVRCVYFSVYNVLCEFCILNCIWGYFFGDLCGSFLFDVGYDIYIRIYYSYINIIGLGDFSSWKVFFFFVFFYMYCVFFFFFLMLVFVFIKEFWG